MKTPEAIRAAVTEAVASLMRGANPRANMTLADVSQLATFVATASMAIVLTRIAAEMRSQQFDETHASAPATVAGAVDIARDLGYRAGHNDAVRSWAQLLTEATHAGR